jgi:pyruvate kinase
MKFRPERDAFGRVTQPAVISFRRDDIERSTHDEGGFSLSLDPWPLEDEQDRFHLEDTRGRRRRLRVRRRGPAGFEAELSRTAYLREGQAIIGSDGVRRTLRGIPAIEPAIHLQVGDELILTAELEPDQSEGDAPRIGCTLPEAFEQLSEGHRVVFDDGKIVAVVREVGDGRARLEIVRTRKARGAKLRPGKGINLPDTDIPVAPLTPEDHRALAFIATHADVVGLSFVRGPKDVHTLLGELDALGASHLPVVAKIETVEAFRALPQILLALLSADRAGVMIARGDLAVESGYERLAELQEEILWLCEAAHMPSIWATQVLEGLTKTGTPSRAEVTDAAMASRAECVMLNKGEFITQAVSTLDDILARMTGHQSKKGSRLRRLRSWYED